MSSASAWFPSRVMAAPYACVGCLLDVWGAVRWRHLSPENKRRVAKRKAAKAREWRRRGYPGRLVGAADDDIPF